MGQKIDMFFKDPRLKIILMGDAPHWGSMPSKTSYVFDAMLRLSYFLGNYYPKGSSQKFADDLGRCLTRRGGHILKCAEVEGILTDHGKAAGVRIRTVSKKASEYHQFDAPVVVSNADALHTYRDLLKDESCSGWMRGHLESLRPTFACFLTHIGLRGMDPKALAAAEGYYWSEPDISDIMRNVFKIFVPTHFDAEIAPEACPILITQRPSPVRIEDVSDWAAHKEQMEGKTMARLREVLPGIDEHIVVKSSASAQTSSRVINKCPGGILGYKIAPGQVDAHALPVDTRSQNLY